MYEGYECMGIYELLGALNAEKRMLASMEATFVFFGGEVGKKLQVQMNRQRDLLAALHTNLAKLTHIPHKEVRSHVLTAMPCESVGVEAFLLASSVQLLE